MWHHWLIPISAVKSWGFTGPQNEARHWCSPIGFLVPQSVCEKAKSGSRTGVALCSWFADWIMNNFLDFKCRMSFALKSLLQWLRDLGPDDVLVDLGCSTGAFVMLAARLSPATCPGGISTDVQRHPGGWSALECRDLTATQSCYAKRCLFQIQVVKIVILGKEAEVQEKLLSHVFFWWQKPGGVWLWSLNTCMLQNP